MVYTRINGDLIEKASTKVQVAEQLQDLEKNDPNWKPEYSRDAWVKWGRKQLPQRLLNMACMIITNAICGQTTDYIKVQNECGGHNWMYHLTDHFSNLCLENNWPFYGVMLVDRTGKAPSGFFKWYSDKVLGGKQINLAIESVLRKDCTHGLTPSAVEIALAVTRYIYNHDL